MTRVAPAKVRKEAKLGLMLHKKWKRGGTAVGVARAVQLSSGKAVSDATIKRMYSYFQRHQHDRLDKDGSDGSIPGRGYIAWLLWGGYSGRKWAESEYKKLKKEKNPISKPVKKIKEDLAKKTVYLMKVSLEDFRSEPWAQDMVTKEEDFEVVDNYDGNGEPIFKTSEYVLSVVPKKYLQNFEFLRHMQMEGKLEKHSFTSAARAWLENDQPLDWFNEQAHDRGYLTKDEYLFLVKVNNPVTAKKNILDEVKTNDEVLQLKSFIQKIGLKKKNPRGSKPWKTSENKSPEHPFIWVKAKILEVAILTALKASGEHGLSLATLSEAILYIMGKKYDPVAIKRLPMTVLRVIDDWRDRKADYVSVAEPTSSSPAHSLMQRKPSSVYIIRSKGIEHLEQSKKEILEALKIADETKDMDSLISLIKRERPEKKENPYKMSNPARNVANVEDVKKFCTIALEHFYDLLDSPDQQPEISQWFKSNFFKGIMNSERTSKLFRKITKENIHTLYFDSENKKPIKAPDFVLKSISEDNEILFFDISYAEDRQSYFPIVGTARSQFDLNHFVDFFESDDFPANPSRVSYDQMIDLVLRWDEKDVKVSDESKIAEGEVVFKEYSDGMKWVLLTNKQAIENESRISRMGHCIGRTGEEETNFYIDKIVDGTGYTFSLRDKENHPYVTCFYELMESSEEDSTEIGLFTQIKGYKNCHINTIAYHQVDKKDRKGIEKLRCSDLPKINSNEKYVIDLIKDEKLEKLTRCKHNTNLSLECDDLFENADFVSFKILTNYAEVDIYDNFAENLERKILTNEQFERFDLKKLNIPNAAIFDIKFNSKTKLPDNLIIFAPTGFDTLDLKALPSNLKIIGNLSLDVPLTSIGHNIIVEGDLLLRDDLNKSHAAFADKIDARNKISAKLKKKRNPLKLIARGFDERPASAYDREELKLGLKTELEHTDDAIIASKIAKDHLDEDPKYYSKLVEMERGMKSNPIYLLFRYETLANKLSYTLTPIILFNKKEKNFGLRPVEIERLLNTFFDKSSKINGSNYRIRSHTLHVDCLGKLIQKNIVEKTDEKYKIKNIELLNKFYNENILPVKMYFSTVLDFLNSVIDKYPATEKFIKSNPKKVFNVTEFTLESKKNIAKITNEIMGLSILLVLLDGPLQTTSILKTIESIFGSLSHGSYYVMLKFLEESGEIKRIKKESSGYELIKLANASGTLEKHKKAIQSLYQLSKDTLDTINEFSRNIKSEPSGEEQKKSNPLTPESEEYLYIIQDSIKGHAPGIDAWVDEESGDILVGWMAFEEDRSFDDVLVRVKTSGRILKGESVDDSTKKSAEKLMKKIHKDLVSYITNKKSNPVPAGVDPKEFDSLVEKLKKRKDVDNPYALANWILKQKNPTAYEKLVKQLAAKGVDDPKALAAWIGRQKYGKEEFQRRAAAGRKKKNPSTPGNEIERVKKEFDEILEGGNNG